MKKILTFSIVLATIISLSGIVSAGMIIPANDAAEGKAKAPEKSPAIGDDWDLARVDFVHYAKPDGVGKPAKPDKNDNICYKLMGVSWLGATTDFVINPTNPQELNEAFIIGAVSNAAETWDDVVTAEVFNNSFAVDDSVDYGVYDGQNAIVFGDYNSDQAIAVTSIWYSRRFKTIVEFDMIFNTRFDWGNADSDPSLMDLENIATHEFGHTIGIADIYSDDCAEVTMYGYSTEGETTKRTLEQPDMDAVIRLYGI